MAHDPAPTVPTPAEVAKLIFDAVTARDPDGIVRLAAPDYVGEFVALGVRWSAPAVREFFSEVFAAFPDFAMHVDRMVADAEVAAVQWHYSGTFTGRPFQGIEANGRRVEQRGVDIMQIGGGLIHHNTIYFDGDSMARQVGLLPGRESPLDKVMLGFFNARTRILRAIG